MSENKVTEVIQAVEGVVKAVPVYQDGLQPAVKEASKGLLVIAQAVNVALSPLRGLVWGYEKIENFLLPKLAEKLATVSPENIVAPAPEVAVPTVMALTYLGEREELREMFANLLARSMDRSTAQQAHPAFVEILKQLTPDESKIISYLSQTQERSFASISIRARRKSDGTGWDIISNASMLPEDAKCEHNDMAQAYVENLARLGVLQIEPRRKLTKDSEYERILSESPIRLACAAIRDDFEPEILRQSLMVTVWGSKFIATCTGSPGPFSISSAEATALLSNEKQNRGWG